MAARVNTRFLIILLIGIISAVVIVGGLWVLKIRGDAGRQARRGDEQIRLAQQATEFEVQQECYRKAREFYKRAINREPSSAEYIEKLEDALLSLHPTTADEARELYREYLAVLTHAADHDPLNASRHRALLEELFRNARRSGSPSMWRMVYESADNMADALPESDPQRIWASFYRGAALFSPRMYDLLLPEDPSQGTQLEQGERNLLEFLQAVPDSDLGWGMLLSGELGIVARLSAADQAGRVREELQELRDHLAQAREQVEGGAYTLTSALRLAMRDRFENPALVDREELRADARELVRRTREANDPLIVTQTVEVLRRLGPMEGVPEPVEIVDEFLQENPLAHDIRLSKADLFYRSNELDEAEAAARVVVDADWLSVGFLSQYQPYLRRAAASLIVDIAHGRWSTGQEGERARLVGAIEEAREDLARLIPEGDRESDTMLMRADAKLAYARQDDERAAALFDRLVRESEDEDVEMYWYAAVCLDRIGQVGRALEHVGSALAVQPDNPEILALAARLSLKVRNHEGAVEAAAGLLSATDEGQNPRIAAAATALREDNFARARDLLDELANAEPENRVFDLAREIANQALAAGAGGEEDPMISALETAQAALDDGEAETARATLVAALEKDPDDLRLLNALVRVSMALGDEAQARQYLQRAQALAPDSSIFRDLALAIDNPDPIERIKRMAEQKETEEGQQALEILIGLRTTAMQQEERARRLEETGQEEEARDARALAERARQEEARYRQRVEELAPHDPRFIEYQFSRAVVAEDWARAEQLVAGVSNPGEPEYNADH
ncbi:MAG: tetratricopeptide repeat protein, partial [Planctomycetota bacterium]|nr:tetratricopeptide repeat protein [Planctomycetota bacterium]